MTPSFAGTGYRRNSRGMSGHHSARPRTTSWGTPPKIIDPINRLRPRQTDPCAMPRPPHHIAAVNYTARQDGLRQPWPLPFFLNPPYTNAIQALFLERAAAEGDGIGLLFARTETNNWVRFVAGAAHAVIYIAGRLNFLYPSGRIADFNAGAPSALIAWGDEDCDVLAALLAPVEYDDRNRVVWPEGMIPGTFHLLRCPRWFLLALAEACGTWREELLAFAGDRQEVELAEAYRWFARRPKVRGRRHWKAKVRQQLQLGPFDRVGPGRYRRKA